MFACGVIAAVPPLASGSLFRPFNLVQAQVCGFSIYHAVNIDGIFDVCSVNRAFRAAV